jgi:hypothetical protein
MDPEGSDAATEVVVAYAALGELPWSLVAALAGAVKPFLLLLCEGEKKRLVVVTVEGRTVRHIDIGCGDGPTYSAVMANGDLAVVCHEANLIKVLRRDGTFVRDVIGLLTGVVAPLTLPRAWLPSCFRSSPSTFLQTSLNKGNPVGRLNTIRLMVFTRSHGRFFGLCCRLRPTSHHVLVLRSPVFKRERKYSPHGRYPKYGL